MAAEEALGPVAQLSRFSDFGAALEWRNDQLGEAIEQLEDMQSNLCATTDVGLAQLIDDVVIRAEAQPALGAEVTGAAPREGEAPGAPSEAARR